jgi:uncharacterized membrane protein YqiK
MPEQLILVMIVVGTLAMVLLGVIILIAKFYRRVEQGKVLIVNTMKAEPIVSFTGAVVYPGIHRAEVMDISVKTIPIHCHGKDAVLCADDVRADIKVVFFVRVNKTTEDVLKVAQSVGCERASDPRALEELFSAKFSEALYTVAGHLDYKTLFTDRARYKDEIISIIGIDLNGFVLDDAAIELVARTPIESL